MIFLQLIAFFKDTFIKNLSLRFFQDWDQLEPDLGKIKNKLLVKKNEIVSIYKNVRGQCSNKEKEDTKKNPKF